jgi:molecular chaperone DnaK (HSP70)
MIKAELALTLFLLTALRNDAFRSEHRPSRPKTLQLDAQTGDGIGIGIDLGTTRSAVAILSENNVPTIIPIPHNGRTMPSAVAFDSESGHVWVGQEACDRQNENGVFRNVKRILGTGGKLTKSVAKAVPFLVPNRDGKTYKKDTLLNQIQDAHEYPTLLQFPHNHTRFSPEIISAHVLKRLVQAAEDASGQKVTRAVIGVPAYFHDEQRAATLRAAEMAGLARVKLLREPEAAALAYGIGKEQIASSSEDELVLVFDLGGGTFDVSMLLVGGGVTEVLCTSGNSQLGGADLDNRVADHCWKVLSHHVPAVKPLEWSEEARNGIVRAAEQIRIALSNAKKVELALPVTQEGWCNVLTGREVLLPVASDESYSETGILEFSHVRCCLTRRTLEKLCDDELQALLRPIREVAIVAGALLPGDANPTAVEAAREMEEQYIESRDMAFADFYQDDEEEDGQSAEENAELLLAIQDIDMKAAKKAQQKGRKRARQVAKDERKYREEKKKIHTGNAAMDMDRVKVRDGISGRPISRVVLVGGTTRMPAIGRLIAALTGVVPQRTVNPDEAVALGCAAKVGVLDGIEGMGTVLNPMQAAILKAVARQQGKEQLQEDDDFDQDFDFEED